VPTWRRDHEQEKPRPRLLLLLTGAVVTAAGVALAFSQSPSSPDDEVLDSPNVPGLVVVQQERFREDTASRYRPDPARGPPVALHVPALGVHVPVINISASAGVLVPPSDPQMLGWWSAGARPGGRIGSVLITGHTVSSGGGAFDDLATLRAGDTVAVGTRKGLIRYAVSGVTVYGKASLARRAPEIFDQSVPSRLVLVTCDDWNGERYLSNAVVVADPIRRPR
jgi:LPXTG-site transpeptidase (sortase) family protein